MLTPVCFSDHHAAGHREIHEAGHRRQGPERVQLGLGVLTGEMRLGFNARVTCHSFFRELK